METVTNILLHDGIDSAQSAIKQLLFMMASARVLSRPPILMQPSDTADARISSPMLRYFMSSSFGRDARRVL